jgi:porphobilinogen synthase
MGYPEIRMRRQRTTPRIRELVRETRLHPRNFVLPLFVRHGQNERRPIASMPGNFQLSVDELVQDCRKARELDLGGVILFGIPQKKDPTGSEGYADDGIIAQALRAVREDVPDLLLIADVCNCEYTDHGHCGVVVDGDVDNDQTLELLARASVCYAKAGADIVAPSDMMDGRVAAVRDALDEAGFSSTAILSYAAKFASTFYGPFRDAAESPPQFGDRRSYQMDPANGREALREVELDVEEGADMVMVKPALPYLDVLTRVKETFGLPTAAYQVSGEFSMIKAAAANGWIDEQGIMMETLTAIRRAGADFILTYFAREAARALSNTK